ncbi:MAG: hypothetical protein PVF27_09560 [Gemmatimonadales bacterium]|jgi:hypothetical protein
MVRTAVWAGVLAAIAASAVVRLATDVPWWTLAATAAIAALPAAAFTVMGESVIEDVVKVVLFGIVALLLGWRGAPAWVLWPIVLGPVVGFLVNRGRPAHRTEPE